MVGDLDRVLNNDGLTVYVGVPDLRASFERALALGATPMWGPSQIHDGLAPVMIRDPEGNAIGLMSDWVDAGESSPDESRTDS